MQYRKKGKNVTAEERTKVVEICHTASTTRCTDDNGITNNVFTVKLHEKDNEKYKKRV